MPNYNLIQGEDQLILSDHPFAALKAFATAGAGFGLCAALGALWKFPLWQQQLSVPATWTQGLLIAAEMAGAVALLVFLAALNKAWNARPNRAWIFDRRNNYLKRGDAIICSLSDLHLVEVVENTGEYANYALHVVRLQGRPIRLARVDFNAPSLHELQSLARHIGEFAHLKVSHRRD